MMIDDFESKTKIQSILKVFVVIILLHEGLTCYIH